MRVLTDLVGNSKFLVKVNFEEWKVLDRELSLSPRDEVRIKVNCNHSSTNYDPLTEYRMCKNCGMIIK